MSQDEVKLLNPQGEKTLAPATDPKTGDTYVCSKVATSLSRIDKVIPKPDPNFQVSESEYPLSWGLESAYLLLRVSESEYRYL